MFLGYFPGFLFDILDDGVDDVRDGIVAGGCPVDLPAFAIALARRRNLELVREKIVDGFDGRVNDFGPEDFRFDNWFEGGLETGVEFVDAKDGGQKQSEAGD